MKTMLKKIIEKSYKKGMQTIYNFLPSHKPNFIIIGAQKSGTSSLHYYLSNHSQIIGSRPKELHYFEKWTNYGYDLSWYESHFKSLNPKDKLFFESSPNYIYYEEVAKNLQQYAPDLKLVVLLRDPVERAYSAWNMYRDMVNRNTPDFSRRKGRYPGEENAIYKYFIKNRDSFPTFSQAIDIELYLMKHNLSEEPAVLRRGLYARAIRTYMKYFSLSKIKIIGFNELKQNTNEVLEGMTEFLNLDVSFDEVNTSKIINKRTYESEITEQEKNFLIDFYKKPNEELFKILGYSVNW